MAGSILPATVEHAIALKLAFCALVVLISSDEPAKPSPPRLLFLFAPAESGAVIGGGRVPWDDLGAAGSSDHRRHYWRLRRGLRRGGLDIERTSRGQPG